MSLIKHFFEPFSEEEQEKMLIRLLESSKRKSQADQRPVMHDALRSLEYENPSDAKIFEGLSQKLPNQKRAELIRSRLCAPKATAEFHTPGFLNRLRPMPKDGGCVLTFQVPTDTFQGYYPRTLTPEHMSNKRVKKYLSISRTFGQKWTQLQALQQVVTFLWECHQKAGEDSLGDLVG